MMLDEATPSTIDFGMDAEVDSSILFLLSSPIPISYFWSYSKYLHFHKSLSEYCESQIKSTLFRGKYNIISRVF